MQNLARNLRELDSTLTAKQLMHEMGQTYENILEEGEINPILSFYMSDRPDLLEKLLTDGIISNELIIATSHSRKYLVDIGMNRIIEIVRIKNGIPKRLYFNEKLFTEAEEVGYHGTSFKNALLSFPELEDLI